MATVFGTQVTYRLKTKRFHLDQETFTGEGHTEKAIELMGRLQDQHELHTDPVTGIVKIGELIRPGDANYFVAQPILIHE